MIILLALFLLVFNGNAPATTSSSISLPLAPHVLEQMELRRGVWMGLKADLTLQFVRDGQSASCQGQLVYDRLREKVSLDCYNLKNELLFNYQTHDEMFELYLPAQNRIVRGNIFELQYDPDLSIHLRPLDLYRALKPMLVEAEQARISEWQEDSLKINITKETEGNEYLARSLLVTKKGDVPEEVFYTPAGSPSVKITREDFMEVKMKDLKRKIPYPRITQILSLEESRKTTLIIRHAEFYLHPPAFPTAAEEN